MKIYDLNVRFEEPMLASSPADPEVYTQFIASRKRDDQEAAGEEVETLKASEKEQIGWSVFHSDAQGLFLFDYKIRGFCKAAAEAVTGKSKLTAYKSKIDKWLFVFPRRIHLFDSEGNPIGKPDGVIERPLRAMTMQGPRVSLKRSDSVNVGTNFKCQLHVLDLGQREITETLLNEWFTYGRYQGFGEWRSGSYGRFSYELTESENSME